MDILLRLGEFKFAMDTAAYDGLTRSVSVNWPSQERLWNAPAVQFTGLGEETISLQGMVLPAWRGGLGQIEQLREMARAPASGNGDPLPLVTGYGEYLGDYVITKVDEQQEVILTRGAPGVQRFTLELKRYVREVFS